jgi:hypothetical protein
MSMRVERPHALTSVLASSNKLLALLSASRVVSVRSTNTAGETLPC